MQLTYQKNNYSVIVINAPGYHRTRSYTYLLIIETHNLRLDLSLEYKGLNQTKPVSR